MKRWVDNWKVLGPILDEERWSRLAAMSDAERQRVTANVLDMWQPGWPSDNGEALLLHQRVFALGRDRT